MAGGNFNPYSHQNNDLSTSAGQRKFHRSNSPSTDDARYVAAKRAASGSQSSGFGGLLGSLFGKDPRDRDRSTFRNPGKQEGIFGYEGFLRPKTGNVFQDLNRFMPMGLISGAINAATTKPVDSGASYTMNTQRGVGPGTGTAPRPSPQQRLSGYAAPQVGTSYLDDQPPEMPMTSVNPLNFNNTEADTFFDLSQPDSAFAGVPPSQRPGAVTQPAGDMGPLMDDLPRLIPLTSASLNAADVSVEPDDAEFQEWLATDGQGEAFQEFAKGMDPGFMRRMYEVAKRRKN